VTAESLILVLVVVTALGFDFTNGFHDTANAMATSIATNALRPKTAVMLSGVLNLVGAFLSVQVALTVTNAVVKIQNSNGKAFVQVGAAVSCLVRGVLQMPVAARCLQEHSSGRRSRLSHDQVAEGAVHPGRVARRG
jgi:phosphate/sulfate permease